MRFLITLAAAVAVSAVPEVTVVPKALTCSNFPFFRQFSSVAGPFSIFAESTGNETIDGNRATYITISDRALATAWLGINPGTEYAAPLIQCQAFGAAEMLAVSVDNNFQPLSISKYIYHEYDGLAFVKTVAPGAPIQPHWHYYANGTRQAGTFLGWNNFTTWAYLLDSRSQRYRIRLLMDDAQKLYDGEFTGFVRVGDPSLSD